MARFLSTDDKALSVVFDTDAAGNVTSDPTVIVAASAANTTGEALALNDLLGVVVRKAAANPKPLTTSMRKISQQTFDQSRRRMEEAKQK
ncbi:MAG: hypothetical protein AB8B96_12255 [Lysobacterales bacterium]